MLLGQSGDSEAGGCRKRFVAAKTLKQRPSIHWRRISAGATRTSSSFSLHYCRVPPSQLLSRLCRLASRLPSMAHSECHIACSNRQNIRTPVVEGLCTVLFEPRRVLPEREIPLLPLDAKHYSWQWWWFMRNATHRSPRLSADPSKTIGRICCSYLCAKPAFPWHADCISPFCVLYECYSVLGRHRPETVKHYYEKQ
jgi:hypothetical protein